MANKQIFYKVYKAIYPSGMTNLFYHSGNLKQATAYWKTLHPCTKTVKFTGFEHSTQYIQQLYATTSLD